MNPTISVVTPVYGCDGCLKELYTRIKQAVEAISPSFEIIMVNDESPDPSWQTIQALAKKDARVKGIALSRNFGQHSAITAGLDYSTGDWVVVMDCDLQDQPEEIKSLYYKAQEGYDIVFARRAKRKDTWLKRMQSKLFYKVYDYFTEGTTDASIANFSICSRSVVDQLCLLREKSRSYPLFLKWLGFKWTVIDVKHAARGEGKSSYNWSKLINLAIDSIVSQSNKPLRLSITFGFGIALFSLIYGLFLIYKYFFLYQPVAGWTSVMVSLYFLGGLTFANLGIIGLYIGKIFDETKDRPLYVVRTKIGFDQGYEPLLTTHEKKKG
ncbi:glycosyl transferase [Pullulanibacillus camelliae]|uniref:Glycosyl transferase n=1 Tax=Pullulanibacillus camelliae TaxID=1707096 RepID=A0A8J2VNT3_9BACL|nr:glycosyltransferase family 2 protein [Pullulanibacillus camelliae]GGE34121.1 glycosyl transferase [Pullulanibacillus camelliae]